MIMELFQQTPIFLKRRKGSYSKEVFKIHSHIRPWALSYFINKNIANEFVTLKCLSDF